MSLTSIIINTPSSIDPKTVENAIHEKKQRRMFTMWQRFETEIVRCSLGPSYYDKWFECARVKTKLWMYWPKRASWKQLKSFIAVCVNLIAVTFLLSIMHSLNAKCWSLKRACRYYASILDQIFVHALAATNVWTHALSHVCVSVFFFSRAHQPFISRASCSYYKTIIILVFFY